tara:strand:- start:5556 stop:6140 length:585 start_codon:yes stop_codon:yes gene_type:complete
MSEKEIENNTSNEEASETVETPESVDSTPETAETVADAEEASAPEESVPEAPAETAEADVPAEEEPAEAVSTAKLEELSPAQIVQNFEKSQLKDDVPPFRPGDTVVVSVKVKEGERTRLQAFEGVVMHIKNAGLNSSFIVRKISSGIGVERTFQVHSPIIDSIKVKRKGDVRKAKLYYLRERSGRSARIKERLE